MMYQQIAQNKRKTWFLMILFSVVIIGLGFVFGKTQGNGSFGIIIATIISIIMTLFSYFQGDAIALSSSGAKEVKKNENPELIRLVENLSITAGLPMPKVYIISDEGMNAFATGRDPKHASVAVTTGLLKNLNKQELEGVLAHELSHIGNYDIRVMTIVVVLCGVVLLLSDWLTRSFFFSRKSESENSSAGVLLIIGIILAVLSPVFAELIKLAVSRSREYLADASGAMITRHPEGLASALEKIALQDRPLKKANHATAHMFLANPFDPHVTKKFEQLFSTHPPIEERIKRLRSL